jgi:uncharacterized phage-associated protein
LNFSGDNGRVRFAYNEGKAGEMAAYLLQWAGGEMPRLKLIKLMYLADRRSIAETGFSITGDRIVGMKKGPVLSATLDHLKGHVEGRGEVSRYIAPVTAREGNRLVEDPPPSPRQLSTYELDVLKGVYREFGARSGGDLALWLHRNAPEWKEPVWGGSVDIDPQDILVATGWSAEAIEAIVAEADYYYGIDKGRGRTASA